MGNQFDNTLVSEMNGGSKRPQFLKVLCILSFVCCGITFLMGIYGLIANTPERMAEKVEQLREFSPSMAQEMEQQIEALQNNTMARIKPYFDIILILVSFLGVMQMFNLKRMGFYIYTAAELIPYIFMVIGGKEAMAMMGSMGGGAMKAAALVMMVLVVLFDVAFIVMYALNLKHMKK